MHVQPNLVERKITEVNSISYISGIIGLKHTRASWKLSVTMNVILSLFFLAFPPAPISKNTESPGNEKFGFGLKLPVCCAAWKYPHHQALYFNHDMLPAGGNSECRSGSADNEEGWHAGVCRRETTAIYLKRNVLHHSIPPLQKPVFFLPPTLIWTTGQYSINQREVLLTACL